MSTATKGARVRLDLLEERYVLGRLLGSGGMGQVWEARDEALGRRVAVKVLAAPAGDATATERFVREARAAARLSHPGIVAVFDVGQGSDGRLFMVMELVEGHSLDELLRAHGPLPTERVAEIGARTAGALAAAHAAGVIHRDVKPANLLLAADSGTVKVADFGIAVLADDTATALTSTSALIGTVPYIAPERALGRPATPASDLYALGCVLYEALAGHPPFRAENVARTLFQHCYQPPEPVTHVNPATAPALAEVVHALLAKDPAARPADAAHTAALLTRCAAQIGPAERTGRTAKLASAGRTGRTEQTDPTKHIDPIGQTGPADGTDPTQQMSPTGQTGIIAETGPAGQTDLTEPLAVPGTLPATQVLPATRLSPVTRFLSRTLRSAPVPDGFAQLLRRAAPRWAEHRRWRLAAVAGVTLTALATGIAAVVDDAGSSQNDAAHSSASVTPSDSGSAAASATVRPTPATGTASLSELVDELTERLEGPVAPSETGLATEVRHRLSDISDRLDAGDLDQAAEMVRGLRARLAVSRTHGIWDGDARTEELLGELAARLPTPSASAEPEQPQNQEDEQGNGQGPGRGQGPGAQ